MRFLGIHPVQSVVNSPTQLSGRGFARIFHMKLVLSQLYVFWCSKMEVGYCNLSKTDFSKRELTPLDPSRKMRSEIPLFLACATALPKLLQTLPQALPEPPRALPELLQTLPELL